MTHDPATSAGFQWQVADPWPGADELARQLRSGRLIAQLLHNRGVDDPDAARAYLNPKLTDLHDPELLGGAVEAAERIARAVGDKAKIVIYGDYDVDGMTGTAILYRGLKMLDADVDYYIPHRIDEGYGLNNEALDTIADSGAGLVVTVDCGITAVDCAAHAAARGLPMIITDHHVPGDTLPEAEAIVHPTLNAAYPNPKLCGAGVALKLIWQILRAYTNSRKVDDRLKAFLLDATCMAALGTIADVVDLTDENRILAMHGLRGLPGTRHPGLRSLMSAAGLLGQRVGAYDVGFMMAPRLNAAGRMGHARDAAELLIRGEEIDCDKTAQYLTKLNTERQAVQREIFSEAADMVVAAGMDQPDRRVIVLAKEGWHGGVIGIVASKLVSRFHRPVVMIALDGAGGRGSARSIPGYHIAEAFDACGAHLAGHGGHAMAAGLSIDADQVNAFTAAMTDHAAEGIPESMLTPTLAVDAEIRMAELSLPIAQQIESMAPFGAGNPKVLLAVTDGVLHAAPKRMGRTGDTLGLILSKGHHRIRCVGFGMGSLVERLVGVRDVQVVGEPSINHFNGRTNVELMLKDIKWD